MEDVLLAINDILQLAVAIGLFAFVIYLFIYLVCSIRSDIGLQKYLKNLENKVLDDISDDVKNDNENIKQAKIGIFIDKYKKKWYNTKVSRLCSSGNVKVYEESPGITEQGSC